MPSQEYCWVRDCFARYSFAGLLTRPSKVLYTTYSVLMENAVFEILVLLMLSQWRSLYTKLQIAE